MVIVGTGGLAREVLTSWELDPSKRGQNLFFFDNVSIDKDLMDNKYPIIHTFEAMEHHFATVGKSFTVCVANPLKRYRLVSTMEKLGGVLTTFVSCMSTTVSPASKLGPGVVIEPGVILARDVDLRKGVFVNAGSIIGHDSVLHEYVSLGPGVRILGGVEVGAFSYIGCNSVICPGVKIGSKVRVGIGKVIDHDLPDNTKA